MNDANQVTSLQVPCRNIRSKEMFHQSADDDEFASGIYWCNKTHESVGPDGEPVTKKQCCESRSCYLR